MVILKLIINPAIAKKLVLRWTLMSPLARQKAVETNPWVKPSDLIGYRRWRNQHRFVGLSGSSVRISTRKVKVPHEHEITYLEFRGEKETLAYHLAGMDELKFCETARLVAESGEIEKGMRNVLWRDWGDWKAARKLVKKCFDRLNDGVYMNADFVDYVTANPTEFHEQAEQLISARARDILADIIPFMEEHGITIDGFDINRGKLSEPISAVLALKAALFKHNGTARLNKDFEGDVINTGIVFPDGMNRHPRLS